MPENRRRRERGSGNGSEEDQSFDRFLPPRHWHGWRLAMPIAARVRGPVAEPGDEPRQLFHGFFVRLSPLLGAGQFGIAENSSFGIAARPRNERRRTRGKQIDPVEGAVLFVEADDSALDLVFPDVVAIKVKIERSFEFAGVGAAAGK